jgi:hypothetical protein
LKECNFASEMTHSLSVVECWGSKDSDADGDVSKTAYSWRASTEEVVGH